jgi:hypothetical protein
MARPGDASVVPDTYADTRRHNSLRKPLFEHGSTISSPKLTVYERSELEGFGFRAKRIVAKQVAKVGKLGEAPNKRSISRWLGTGWVLGLSDVR